MRYAVGLLSVGLAWAALGVSSAAEDLGKDLAATIALHNMPCDKVTSTKRNGDSDYTATCQNGTVYHVYVDSSGRVIVQKM